MDKVYNPHSIEQARYKIWENKAYFTPIGKGKSYCIMLPPPNVTGSLHMGHAFQGTLMDILIRYHRMLGDKVLWQAGTDHAGIATQMVVERLLQTEKKSRHALGREAFIERTWEWKKESGGRITQQFRRLGASMDWERERFTLDENLSKAVREAFIRLYEEGLIYRGKRLVNWDPVLLTAISDLEVINQEEEGKLWHIAYPLLDEEGEVVVATTRPETLFGDVAVAVHPEDERYQHLIGKQVRLPLTERTIPIIGNHSVDPQFGTGCLKITPGHDFNDYNIGLQHQLTPINILTPQAHLNENVPSPYQGLERFEARKRVLQDLENQGSIKKIEKHKLKVPRGDRSGAVIEPYLTLQWYLKMEPLAKPAIEAVQKGKIRFIPENWDKTYYQWMNNIEDWCISRQLWWGHRIPVWYDEEGKPYAGHNEEDVRTRHQLKPEQQLVQEEDVLDTWFSSSLWPFSTLGWPERTKDLAQFFPTQVLVTGFDIIFFWVARMIMMSLKFMNQVPFQDIYITGLIRDAEGQKMSKSKGNILDPIDLIDGIRLDELIKKRTYGLMQPAMAEKIEKATREHFPQGIPSFGTDSLRMTLSSLASYTREIRFDLGRLEGYRNFCNKLWNASRFVLMNVEGKELKKPSGKSKLSLADRWILSRLQKTIEETKQNLALYRFDLLTQTLYDFTWNQFCDWYLELVKVDLNAANRTHEEQSQTRYNLVFVLETLLCLLHPIIPFITEEIWLRFAPLLNKKGDTLMQEPYPLADESKLDLSAEAELDWVQSIVLAIRTIRSQMNISPTKPLNLFLTKGTAQDKTRIQDYQDILGRLARLSEISWIEMSDKPPQSVSAFVGNLELIIPLENILDLQEEAAKIKKEIARLQKEITKAEGKLNNPNFMDRAPPEVITQEKTRILSFQTALRQQEEQLNRMNCTPEEKVPKG